MKPLAMHITINLKSFSSGIADDASEISEAARGFCSPYTDNRKTKQNE